MFLPSHSKPIQLKGVAVNCVSVLSCGAFPQFVKRLQLSMLTSGYLEGSIYGWVSLVAFCVFFFTWSLSPSCCGEAFGFLLVYFLLAAVFALAACGLRTSGYPHLSSYRLQNERLSDCLFEASSNRSRTFLYLLVCMGVVHHKFGALLNLLLHPYNGFYSFLGHLNAPVTKLFTIGALRSLAGDPSPFIVNSVSNL